MKTSEVVTYNRSVFDHIVNRRNQAFEELEACFLEAGGKVQTDNLSKPGDCVFPKNIPLPSIEDSTNQQNPFRI